LAGERPSLGPLLPVVLPFSELPVVVELAACPPEAELPPAVAPALLPGLLRKGGGCGEQECRRQSYCLKVHSWSFHLLEPDQRTILFDRSTAEAISFADDSCLVCCEKP
jgi:hypothetical protein